MRCAVERPPGPGVGEVQVPRGPPDLCADGSEGGQKEVAVRMSAWWGCREGAGG